MTLYQDLLSSSGKKMNFRKEVIYLSGIEIHVTTDPDGWISLATEGYKCDDAGFLGLISLIRSAQTDKDRADEAHSREMDPQLWMTH